MSSSSEFLSPADAGQHCIEWFRVEEETYASQTKFGYERNLRYLHEHGIEPNSVWASQLTQYWDRATLLDRQLRDLGADTLNARQLFAKHANASRALFTTVIARLNGDNYEYGKAHAEEQLLETALALGPDDLPLQDATSFYYEDYWARYLSPYKEQAANAVKESMTSSDETHHLKRAELPLGQFTLNSFVVVTSYVYLEGSLPQPGLPSGDTRPWLSNN